MFLKYNYDFNEDNRESELGNHPDKKDNLFRLWRYLNKCL